MKISVKLLPSNLNAVNDDHAVSEVFGRKIVLIPSVVNEKALEVLSGKLSTVYGTVVEGNGLALG